MNDKPLGMIRVVTANGHFEVPYMDNTDFIKQVMATRAYGGFEPIGGGVFVPFHAIQFMVQVPQAVLDGEREIELSKGVTRQ